MTKFYTGVGSRETPNDILAFMETVGKAMTDLGYIGRSGGADGADTAFWNGFLASSKLDMKFECYIPWDNFNGLNSSQKHIINSSKLRTYNEAQELMKTIHPAPERLSRGALALHTRNVFQVLGYDLISPSNVLFCYTKMTKAGKPSGGTATAYNLAREHKIKCYNFFYPADVEEVKSLLKL